jgi:hypothetical protein
VSIPTLPVFVCFTDVPYTIQWIERNGAIVRTDTVRFVAALGPELLGDPLTSQLLDLIKLMPAAQQQVILDFALDMRAIRARHAAAPEQSPFAKHAVTCASCHGFMSYDIEDDRLHCRCGAVATTHGNIIVGPDLVDMEPKRG